MLYLRYCHVLNKLLNESVSYFDVREGDSYIYVLPAMIIDTFKLFKIWTEKIFLNLVP